MKLPDYVILKPQAFRFIPFIGNKTANSIGSFIFLPLSIYIDLQSPDPDPRHIALLIHEETHRKRQEEIGFMKFGIQYVLNSKFRFAEELLAVKEAMKYLKKNNISFDFDNNTKFHSHYIYLWPLSKNLTGKALEKIWNEI